MNAAVFTTSEVIVLCGERFVDQVRSADTSTECTLCTQKTVNAERLAVAAIRGAILDNQAAHVLQVSWRAEDELKRELKQLSGVGGAMFGALSRLSVLDKPSPHLEPGEVQPNVPLGTLEGLLAVFEDRQARGVVDQIQRQVHGRPSGVGVILKVKQSLSERGLLEVFPRGFGMLAPGFKLNPTARRHLEMHLPKVEAMLNAAKRNDSEMWNGLEETITTALRMDD